MCSACNMLCSCSVQAIVLERRRQRSALNSASPIMALEFDDNLMFVLSLSTLVQTPPYTAMFQKRSEINFLMRNDASLSCSLSEGPGRREG